MGKTLHVFWNSQNTLTSEHERTLKVFYDRFPAMFGKNGKKTPTYYDKDIDALLIRISEEQTDVSWCVVHSVGTMVADQSKIIKVFDRLIEDQKDPVLVIGQLINKKNTYCGIHEQTFVVNMDIYNQLGQPAFGDYTDSRRVLANYTAGPSLHDDYTPTYIEPVPGEQEYRTWTCGWNFVDASLRAGYSIRNLPDYIRREKLFFYPGDESKLLNDAVDQIYQMKFPQNVSQRRYLAYLFLKKVGLTSPLSGSPFSFGERTAGVFIFNTELLIPDPVWIENHGKPLNVYIGACAGFLDISNLFKFGFYDNTRLVYYDYNMDSLNFKKYLWENFDGEIDNLSDCIKRYKAENPKVEAIEPYTEQENIERLLAVFNNDKSAFKTNWLKIAALKKDYHLVNFIFEYENLFHGLNSHERIFWSISDIFLGGNEILWGIDRIQNFYEDFLLKAARFDNMIVQGKAPDDKFVIQYAKRLVSLMGIDKTEKPLFI